MNKTFYAQNRAIIGASVGDQTTDWVLVQFKPNSDAVAVRNLERQGFEVFLPKIEATIRKPNKFVRKERPLFPGYLFVNVNLLAGGWRAINSTYGVARIVTVAGKPARVPDGLVGDLKARCDLDSVVHTSLDLSVGKAVRVEHGPFASWIGKIISLPDEKRVWLLLDVLGGETKVVIERSSLSEV